MAVSLRASEVLHRLRGAVHKLAPVGLNIGRGGAADFPPLRRDGLQAQCLRGWPEDPVLVAQWDELAWNSPGAHPFLTPTWLRGVIEQFVPKGMLRLVIVRQEERLVGVFPLHFTKKATLETPGRYLSDYLEPAVDAALESPVWSIFLDLFASLWDWSLVGLVLPHIREHSSCRALLKTLAPRHGFGVHETQVNTVSRIDLPDTFDEYLEALPGRDRKELKRKIRNAQTKAGATFSECGGLDAFIATLERSLSQMERCHNHAKARFVANSLHPLLTRVGPALFDAGRLKVSNLIIEGKTAASLLWFDTPSGPMNFNVSYDESAQQWSPGAVTFAMAIEQAIGRKAKVFDLLRGDEDYKRRLGAEFHPLYRLMLTR